MKIASRRIILALVIGTSLNGVVLASDSKPITAKRITVIFSEPEKFTDVKQHDMDTDNERGGEHYLPLLEEHIEEVGERLLLAGERLTITFTDIDLAGDFEPWRGGQFMDVRIVKGIYVPRLKLTFSLAGEGGEILKDGERELVDLAYQMRITSGFRDDPLRYEKEMLRDWLRREFGKRKR